jgi:hypothetical protein
MPKKRLSRSMASAAAINARMPAASSLLPPDPVLVGLA